MPIESWIGGPYFRRAASWEDILESRLYYWQPSLLLDFAANRALPSYCYRRGLDNWIFACLKSGRLSTSVFERNAEKVSVMSQHVGFAPFGDGAALTEQDVPRPCQRPWRVDFAADLWVHNLLETCRRQRLAVVFCCPPVPPFAEQDRLRSGYYPAREEYLAKLRAEFPTVDFAVFAPGNYTLEMFRDDHHFSRAGRIRLSNEFATWLEDGRRDGRQ